MEKEQDKMDYEYTHLLNSESDEENNDSAFQFPHSSRMDDQLRSLVETEFPLVLDNKLEEELHNEINYVKNAPGAAPIRSSRIVRNKLEAFKKILKDANSQREFEDVEKQMTELADNNNDILKENSKLTTVNQELMKKLDIAKNQLTETSKNFENTLQSSQEKLTKENAVLQKKLSKLTDTNATLTQKLKDEIQQTNNLNRQVGQLEEEIQRSKNDQKVFDGTLKDLRKNSVKQTAQLNELNQKLKQKDDEIAQVKAENTQLQRNAQESIRNFELLETQNKQLKQQNEQSLEKLNKFQADLDTAEGKANTLRTQLDASKTLESKQKETIETLQQKNVQISDDLKKSQAALALSQENFQTAKTEANNVFKQQTATIDGLKSENSTSQRQITSLQIDLAKAQKELKDQKSLVDASKLSFNEQNQKLLQDLDKTQKESSRLLETQKKLEQEKIVVEQQFQQSTETLQKMKQGVASLTLEKSKLENDLGKLKKDVSKLNETLQKSEETNRKLKQDFEELKKVNASNESEANQMLKRQVNERDSQIEKLREEINVLKTQAKTTAPPVPQVPQVSNAETIQQVQEMKRNLDAQKLINKDLRDELRRLKEEARLSETSRTVGLVRESIGQNQDKGFFATDMFRNLRSTEAKNKKLEKKLKRSQNNVNDALSLLLFA